jgi:hypothetical protein
MCSGGGGGGGGGGGIPGGAKQPKHETDPSLPPIIEVKNVGCNFFI